MFDIVGVSVYVYVGAINEEQFNGDCGWVGADYRSLMA